MTALACVALSGSTHRLTLLSEGRAVVRDGRDGLPNAEPGWLCAIDGARDRASYADPSGAELPDPFERRLALAALWDSRFGEVTL